MSSWSCRHEVKGICKKVDGAYCRPGMKGCVLAGKVKFQDGKIPAPVWPPEAEPAPAAAPGEEQRHTGSIGRQRQREGRAVQRESLALPGARSPRRPGTPKRIPASAGGSLRDGALANARDAPCPHDAPPPS